MPGSGHGGVFKTRLERLWTVRFPVPVRVVLAADTKGSPRDRDEALRTDVLLTVGARAIGTAGNPCERLVDLTEQARLSIHLIHREFALHQILDRVESVGSLLDLDAVTAFEIRNEFNTPGLEDFFDMFEPVGWHLSVLSVRPVCLDTLS